MKISGINIALNDEASKIAFKYAKKSFKNIQNIKSVTKDGDFSGGFEIFPYGQASTLVLENISIASDGIGTKIEIAERLNKYDTLGYDLLAMVCDDLISNFYIPQFISNILDIDYIDLNIVDELMNGLYAASKEANVIISGGEIAELGNRIGGYGNNMHFNWGATAVGFKIPHSTSSIQEGDFVYALGSNGFRSNGFSLARKILYDNYGEFWHDFKFNKYETWGSILLKPSKIYTPIIKNMLENNVLIKKIAHITGGGFINNTKRILPDNLSINITNPIKTPSYFLKLMELGNISKEQADITWNMGYGMVLITNDKIDENILSKINWPLYAIGRIEKNLS
jgi:phosphoribosylformylglycinamidine cyclo-ligase